MADSTHEKYLRAYVGGYDLSGDTMSFGPMGVTYEPEAIACWSDSVKAVRSQGHPQNSMGSLAGLMTPTANRLHALYKAGGNTPIITVACGMMAVPAAGDETFSGKFLQRDYIVSPALGSGYIPSNLTFESQPNGALVYYQQPWGVLLHANAAATAVNSGTADHDNGASSSLGGYGVLQVLAGNGTCTFTIEHSAANDDPTFDATGAIVTFSTTDASSPFAEIKEIAPSTTVQRYLRWQIALGTATTVTFVLSFHRGAANG